MSYLIGTDEAGYGPNLGPLVISATVWQVPRGVGAGELYPLLADTVVASPEPLADGPRRRVPIADSKRLYQPGKGLCNLESGLFAALEVLGRRPETWQQAWQALAPEATKWRRAIPWYAGYDAPVPYHLACYERDRLACTLRAGLASARIRLLEIRSRAIFEEQFNRLLEQHLSKGAVLSHATFDLIAQLLGTLENEPVFVVCDKHGGRIRYRRLLEDHFPGALIEVCGETSQRSVYRFGPPDRRIEVAFQVNAESLLPVALASMASKYLRELAMDALNAFWGVRVPGLRPTAGYPQDARRFKAAIAAAQAALGIPDSHLWRMR